MKRNYSYRPSSVRRILAMLLIAILLQAVLLKEAHHLFENHHDEALHCFTFGGEKHLHSEEYAHPDCRLCFLNLPPAQIEAGMQALKAPELFDANIYRSYKNPFTNPICWNFQRRGPPPSTV